MGGLAVIICKSIIPSHGAPVALVSSGEGKEDRWQFQPLCGILVAKEELECCFVVKDDRLSYHWPCIHRLDSHILGRLQQGEPCLDVSCRPVQTKNNALSSAYPYQALD